jgi:hypothetical protein
MTSDELISRFQFPKEGFEDPIKWTDGVGFSLVKEYGDGFASQYKIGFLKPFGQNEINYLWVSAYFGKKIPEGISLGTGAKGIWDPIDIDFYDKYSFKTSNSKFYKENVEIDPSSILKDIRSIHELPTKKVKGFLLRLRLGFWRKILPRMISWVDRCLTLLLWLISGEITKGGILNRLISNESKPGTTFTEGKTLKFFGYEAKRWSVIFYCTMHLIAFLIFPCQLLSNKVIGPLIQNNFLILCYVVTSFAFTEVALPKIIKRLIEGNIKLYGKISFMTLKIHF